MSRPWFAPVVSSVRVFALALAVVGLPACHGESRRPAHSPSILDVDSNGKADALTDGILIMRRLKGESGSTLTKGVIRPGASRTSPAAIQEYIDSIKPRLDIDGNGTVDPATDGTLIIRYMLHFHGPALIDHAIGAGATRTTSAQIERYLSHL